MQNPETGMFHTADDEKELLAKRDAFIANLEGRGDTLTDKRNWPIFKNGETVYVRNEDGAEAKCIVESIGQKFMRLRGIPR